MTLKVLFSTIRKNDRHEQGNFDPKLKNFISKNSSTLLATLHHKLTVHCLSIKSELQSIQYGVKKCRKRRQSIAPRTRYCKGIPLASFSVFHLPPHRPSLPVPPHRGLALAFKLAQRVLSSSENLARSGAESFPTYQHTNRSGREENRRRRRRCRRRRGKENVMEDEERFFGFSLCSA